MPPNRRSGVSGTVDGFNFIRRIGFPSTPRVLAIFSAIALLSASISLLPSNENLAQTLVFVGAVLVWPAVLGEFLNSTLILHKEKVLDFRRLMGLETIAILPIGVLLTIFSWIGLLIGQRTLWEYGFLVGLAISLPIRFLSTDAISSLPAWRKMFAALTTPILITASFLALSYFVSPGSSLQTLFPKILILLVTCSIVSAIGVSFIIHRVEQSGRSEIGHSPMGLFRSFLDHWLRKNPTALEERLLSLSTEGSIETKILSFSGEDSRQKASLVVSNFHPGPYRDMGSGGLPSQLKHSLEESQHGVVQVPHGISNHNLNIVSHRDIDRLLSAAKENYPSDHLIRKASSMIREIEGEVIVSGQAFGNIALLTITLAPMEMEDLPTSVSTEIETEASRLGFDVLIVDAHNSIVGQTSITPIQAERIVAAAVRVLGRLKALSQEPFSVGCAYNALDTYTLKDGIGPGGLSVMVVRTEGEIVSYITIDGNNMQRGLRNHILQSIRETGVSDAEVMTTDTHLVTGLVRSPLGYYPVGAALPTATFVTQITQTVQKAMSNLEESSAGFSKFSLQLQVLGSETFQSITGFIGRIARQIGRSFYWLEGASFLIAIIVLFVV
jgi:predicted neutral ceramidase superfamily lipid hydrolase